MIIACSIPGCLTKIEVGEGSPATIFVCKNHPRKEQVELFGRDYDPNKDHEDEKEKFDPSEETFAETPDFLPRSNIRGAPRPGGASDWSEIYRVFGDDPATDHGITIIAPRYVTQRRHGTPTWFADRTKVMKFLFGRFPWANRIDPKCLCDRCRFPDQKISPRKCRIQCRPCREFMKAAKWLVVMDEWFVLKENPRHIEQDHRWPRGTVHTLIQKIRRAANGVRLDGTARTGRPRGRPKNPETAPANVAGVSASIPARPQSGSPIQTPIDQGMKTRRLRSVVAQEIHAATELDSTSSLR
jgi:hypothetical protein